MSENFAIYIEFSPAVKALVDKEARGLLKRIPPGYKLKAGETKSPDKKPDWACYVLAGMTEASARREADSLKKHLAPEVKAKECDIYTDCLR